MKKIAALGILATLALTGSACASHSPVGPPYIAPHGTTPNPTITAQNGITSITQEFGSNCTQLRATASLSSMPSGEAIFNIPMLSTYASLIKRTELAAQLYNDINLTVIAPSNDAWARLRQRLGAKNYASLMKNPVALDKILHYLLIVHRYSKAGLLNQGAVTTLQGAAITIRPLPSAISMTDNTRHSGTVDCGKHPDRKFHNIRHKHCSHA